MGKKRPFFDKNFDIAASITQREFETGSDLPKI